MREVEATTERAADPAGPARTRLPGRGLPILVEESVQLAPATHDFLKALASPTRQRIMLLFAQGTELSVSEVAEQAGVSQSTASAQLALLRRGRILSARRDGKVTFYRSDRDGTLSALADLQAYLLTCC